MKSPDLFNAQLFLDNTWIEDSAFVTRQWHQPVKYPDPVLVAENPWERWCPVLYGSVLKRSDLFQMWYCGWTREGHQPRVCYAESLDGASWRKPSLGLCAFEGSTENNIVMESAYELGLIDDLTVIDDAEDEEWPLKALYWDGTCIVGGFGEGSGIHLARSKDGINWDRTPGLVLPDWGDRFNAAPTRLSGKYVVFGRAPERVDCVAERFKERAVWRSESEDLIHWSKPTLVLAADVEDAAAMQVYSAVPFRYGDLLLGGIERMHMSPDRLDTEISWSHDEGVTWQRSGTRPSFIPWGSKRTWDDTWINLPANPPIQHQRRLWFYYSGRSGAHAARYPLNHGGIGIGVLRIDGFASIKAEERTGYVLTRPMQWPDGELYVNLDPRRNIEAHHAFECGELTVEVRDESNLAIEGLRWANCMPLRKNTADLPYASRCVQWQHDKSLRALAGRHLRLAFRMRDVHLYSFRAVAPSEKKVIYGKYHHCTGGVVASLPA